MNEKKKRETLLPQFSQILNVHISRSYEIEYKNRNEWIPI